MRGHAPKLYNDKARAKPVILSSCFAVEVIENPNTFFDSCPAAGAVAVKNPWSSMQDDDKRDGEALARLPAVVPTGPESFIDMIRRRAPPWLGPLASLVLFVAAALLLFRVLANISLAGLGDALAATSGWQILKAVALTGLSYIALTGYDVVALRQIGATPPYKVAGLASFASYAISFNLGFPIVTSAAVRFWVYSRAQLTALQVANITIFAGVTFWLGMTLMLGVGLIAGAGAIAVVDGLPAFIHFILGGLIAAAVGYYCLWTAMERRHVRLRGHELELPGLPLTLMQLALGVADLCAAAGALYVLMPQGVELDFLPFVAVYVFACLLGVVSHAPGGIGVFEATMLHAIPGPSQESVLASLLMFRVVYYFLPFVVALAMLGADEGARRWSALREAIARIIEEKLV